MGPRSGLVAGTGAGLDGGPTDSIGRAGGNGGSPTFAAAISFRSPPAGRGAGSIGWPAVRAGDDVADAGACRRFRPRVGKGRGRSTRQGRRLWRGRRRRYRTCRRGRCGGRVWHRRRQEGRISFLGAGRWSWSRFLNHRRGSIPGPVFLVRDGVCPPPVDASQGVALERELDRGWEPRPAVHCLPSRLPLFSVGSN